MSRNNNSTTEAPNDKELLAAVVNAGCSGAFAACVVTEVNGRNIAKEVARKTVAWEEQPPMGGFTKALWDGNLRAAERRADSQSKELMKSAVQDSDAARLTEVGF